MPEELNIVMKASDILKKDEFHKAFKEVLEIILRKEKVLEKAISELQRAYNTLIDRISKEHEVSLTDLKQRTNQLFVGDRLKTMDSDIKKAFSALQDRMLKEVDKKLKEADIKVSNLKPLKGDKGEQGIKGESPTAEELKLIIIPVFDEFKESLETRVREAINAKGRLGMRKIPIVRRIRLTNEVDGEKRVFTLPRDTVDVLGIWSSQFPFTMDTVDWTLTGNTLTLADGVPAIQKGQTLMCLIEALFYP